MILRDFNEYCLYALYVVVIVMVLKMFKRPIRKLGKITFAAMMNRFSHRYNKKMRIRKEKLFAEMTNMTLELRRPLEVLEIGAGSGSNFQFYPKGTNIMCADPNPHFDSYIKSNSSKFPHINLREFLVCKGEDMSQLLNSSIDAVVCTLVLCTVDDVDQCLTEIKRVLRPGGKFFFMEHVVAEPNTTVSRIQHLLNPVWGIIADGCCLTRDISKNINEAGFTKVNLEKYTIQFHSILKGLVWPPILRPHCSGYAMK